MEFIQAPVPSWGRRFALCGVCRGADQLYGDGGDDNISISLRGGGRLLVDGGAGNDTIYAANGGGPNQSVTFIGGEGNDAIGLDGFAADNIIDAGIGDDVVRLGSTLGVTVTLGAGADALQLNSNFFPNPDAVIITDYAPGVDRIVPNFETLLSGWSGSTNPFGEGYVRLVQDGADTLFQVDRNGGGDSYVTKLRFQNTQAASFTAADFGGYPPDGSPPPGQTIVGTAESDVLEGTVGADTISASQCAVSGRRPRQQPRSCRLLRRARWSCRHASGSGRAARPSIRCRRKPPACYQCARLTSG